MPSPSIIDPEDSLLLFDKSKGDFIRFYVHKDIDEDRGLEGDAQFENWFVEK